MARHGERTLFQSTHSALWVLSFALAIGLLGFASLAMAAEKPPRIPLSPSFAKDVVPVLNENCTSCHTPPSGSGYKASGLDMSSYDGLMRGTKHGPIIVPYDAFTSNLIVLIEGRAHKSITMPHGRKKIDKWKRNIIRRWIDQGAQNN